ncbi:MAG: ABC transporter ATP-binding protein [Lachnospiraceae bacterium]|nr:ABC transporter ATP-binding protein [Lachnospiraceae bacterium]
MIRAEHIKKSFNVGKENELEILHGIDLTIRQGEFISIVGSSGSGKSTLMNILGLLDKPSEGGYFLDEEDLSRATDQELSRLRNQKIGFVFQNYNLIARTNALKNVELPMLYGRVEPATRQRRAVEMLRLVEMEDRMYHTPDQLSGGQKQRVAIARALANQPSLLLADEPTGALDSATGRVIMDLFWKLHTEAGITIVLITHSEELAQETERIFTLKDGQIIGERRGMGHAA